MGLFEFSPLASGDIDCKDRDMNSNFWGEMAEEYLKDHPELPPLTDEVLALCEKRIGLKLPKALTDLLRIKNGGRLQNTDFRFNGEEYSVTYITAVTSKESFDSLRSYAFIMDAFLDEPEMCKMREQLQKKVGDLKKVLCVADPGGHPYAFALNYNHLNSFGEPTVYCVELDYDEVDAKRIADSFDEFIAGQYFGEEHPTVNLDESGEYELIAEGGYDGRYEGTPEPGLLSGLAVRVRWKICSNKNRLVLFQDIDWGGRLEITREEIHKSALIFDFPSLESHGLEVEPDLAELIRPGIEIDILSKYGAPLIPDCYELLLHVQPGGKKWVRIDRSSPYQGRWKNSTSNVVYSSLKSLSKVELVRTLQAVIASCSTSL